MCQSQTHKESLGFGGLNIGPYLPGTSPKGQVNLKAPFAWRRARNLRGQFLASLEVWEWTMSPGLVSVGLSKGWAGRGLQGRAGSELPGTDSCLSTEGLR